MKLVLKENIRGLGNTGDVVNVKNGYGRNYLLPQGKASFPTADMIGVLRRERERYLVTEKDHISAAQTHADDLKELVLEITMKANEAGQLFGSITEAIVAEALTKKLGRDFNAKQVILGSHFKRVGDYVGSVRLHSEVETEFGLKVVAEETEDQREERIARAEAAAEAEAAAAAEEAAEAEGDEGEKAKAPEEG
ncbi:MAG: 50S ribosomal protein L9 [Planctomycetota bacterium]